MAQNGDNNDNPAQNLQGGRVNIPLFFGHGVSSPGKIGVHEWISKVEQVSQGSGWTAAITADRAKYAMQDKAQRWLQNLVATEAPEEHNEWPAFKEQVVARFAPHTTMKEMADLQTTLKQGAIDKDEDVASFLDWVTEAVLKFEKMKPAITAQIPDAARREVEQRDRETQINRLFVSGLKPHIRTLVNVLPHRTTDELLQSAKNAESTAREQNPAKNPILHPQVSAIEVNEPGQEKAADEPRQESDLNAKVAELTAQVDKLTKFNNRNRGRGGNRGNRGGRGGFHRGRGGQQNSFRGCYNCRGYGHISAQCPSPRRENRQQQQQHQQQSQAINTNSDWVFP